jgi:hypothetical protein
MTWSQHIDNCEECSKWSKKGCDIQGHSPKSKNNLLLDIGYRQYTLERKILIGSNGKTCCEMGHCTHEFFGHQGFDIQACYEENCAEHHEMKIRSGKWPRIPRITVKRAQKCPCFRRGCLCNYDQIHNFHASLVERDVCRFHEDEIRKIVEEIKETQQKTQELMKEVNEMTENTAKIQKTLTIESSAKQLDVKLKVGKETVSAIIDYVNESWCREKMLSIRTIGEGNNGTTRSTD